VIYSRNNIEYLTPADIEAIIWAIVAEWPDEDIAVRDHAGLDSATHSPMNAPDGLCLLDISALYFQSFEGNQSLKNGNKRLAIYAVALFLEKNGHIYECDDDEAYTDIKQMVETRPFDKAAFASWLGTKVYPPIRAAS